MSAVLETKNDIHHTAIIEAGAVLGEGNTIGPYCFIGRDVILGFGNRLECYVAIGTSGQYRGQESKGGVSIGNNNRFHEHSQVHKAMKAGERTTVGDNGYFMANAHIAHDCVIEDDVTMCNNATLGGHVTVMKGATLGFGSIVHQGQTIGAYSMLGMGATVPKGVDIEVGEKYAGNPAKHLGRNIHALKKQGITSTTDQEIRFWNLRKKPDKDRFIPAAREMARYMKTRSRKFQSRRYEIARGVIPSLPYLRPEDAADLYNMAFSLLWQQHEDFKADQIFIRELLIDAVCPPIPSGGEAKGKIGWLLNHVATGTYAPYKHVHAYLSGMSPCEVFVHGSVRERDAAKLTEMGHNVTHIKGSVLDTVEAVRVLCKEREVGCLISDIYTAVPLWCFKERVAPLQVYLSPGFQLFPADLVLLPETQELILNSARLKNYEFIPTAVTKENLYQYHPRKSPGKVFGCLSRAEKCSDEYLDMVVDILESAPGSSFHFYGRGELGINHPRIIQKGIENAHKALSQIDVYLDTYPTCSGLSAYEAMAHGVPVVTLDHPSVQSWNQFKPCVVSTKEEYKLKAIQALDNGAEISRVGREIVESRIANIPRAVDALYRALRKHGWQP